MEMEALDLERLADDVEVRRAAAKTLKGFCLTYLPHHFPADLSDFFDEMAQALENHDLKRLEMIGFRGCAKSTMASLALVLWAALEHADRYPFIIMLADTTAQAGINMAAVQHELRENELLLRDYGHLKYRKIDDPRPEPTLVAEVPGARERPIRSLVITSASVVRHFRLSVASFVRFFLEATASPEQMTAELQGPQEGELARFISSVAEHTIAPASFSLPEVLEVPRSDWREQAEVEEVVTSSSSTHPLLSTPGLTP
jgi:hypothetical protein